MKNLIAPLPVILWLASILLAAPAMATTTDVTNDSLVTLQTSDSLLFYISSGTSSCSSCGEIQMILGSMPLGGPVVSIPGTSGVYLSGILFSGSIESQDGSISIPLTDPDATRLDLPAGDILLTPGSRSGGSYSGSIDLLSADVALTSAEASELYSSGEAVIQLEDIGAGITFGYTGTPIVSDFSASLISSDGSQSTGARVMNVESAASPAPEPGTIGLLIIGLSILGARLRKAISR